jgi:hypothetical protein
MSGLAEIAPYSANGQRLALEPVRFGPGPGGSTALSTVAQLDGSFPGGRVTALRLPITGQIGHGGSFAFGTSCAVVSFSAFQISTLQLGPARLPLCPVGPAIIAKQPSGTVQANVRFAGPVLNGRSAVRRFICGPRAADHRPAILAQRIAMQLGKPEAPTSVAAARLQGHFSSNGLRGRLAAAGRRSATSSSCSDAGAAGGTETAG